MTTNELTMEAIKEIAVFASFFVPLVTGIVAAIKLALPDGAKRYMPAAAILIGMAMAMIVFGFTVPGAVAGIIIGLGATGLWEIGKTTIAGK
jgi:uncharacterized protein (UPF0254 family)